MKKTTALLVILCIVLSFMLGSALQSKADGQSFAGVMPFATASGLTGFFNQNDGKVYIYDTNISQPSFIGQIETLGKPITTIKAVDLTMKSDETVPYNHK